MNYQRPKNLNLFTIHFPIPAIASILHRLSGAVLFLLIPFFLWAFNLSLSSAQHFEDLHSFLSNFFIKLIIWVSLAAFFYHFLAGIRHLLMDIHVGDTLKSGRFSAILVIILTLLLVILSGIWLW